VIVIVETGKHQHWYYTYQTVQIVYTATKLTTSMYRN